MVGYSLLCATRRQNLIGLGLIKKTVLSVSFIFPPSVNINISVFREEELGGRLIMDGLYFTQFNSADELQQVLIGSVLFLFLFFFPVLQSRVVETGITLWVGTGAVWPTSIHRATLCH